MSDSHSHPWPRLENLPMAAKVCISCFLISVGVGYFSALVQLHFQHASPGSLMPTMKDVVKTFHGHVGAEPKCRLERLLLADENEPFNGTGQMSAAFTIKSSGWEGKIKKKALEIVKARVPRGAAAPTEEDRKQAEESLRAERKGEVNAIIAWINAGAPQEAFEQDKFQIVAELKDAPFTADLREDAEECRYAKIQSIIEFRCQNCHAEGKSVGKYPLQTYEQVAKYLKIEKATAMSVEKLTQTTHVHLLSFSMLYFLTGVLLAMTPYPALIRVPLASIPLVFQLLDISCWWLARLEGDTGVWFAQMIPITGGVVGVGLMLQILLTLFGMYKSRGRMVLVLLIVAAGYGGYKVIDKVIIPHMQAEQAAIAEKK